MLNRLIRPHLRLRHMEDFEYQSLEKVAIYISYVSPFKRLSRRLAVAFPSSDLDNLAPANEGSKEGHRRQSILIIAPDPPARVRPFGQVRGRLGAGEKGGLFLLA